MTMSSTGIYLVNNIVVVLIGFALGRIKNASKLAQIKAVLVKAETALNEETKKLAAEIKAKL